MKAEIISVGSELVSGLTVDTNSAWLAQGLAEAGLDVPRHTTVADDADAVAEAVREAARRADVVIITGGLGPTADDLTRDAIARVLGVELRAHPDAMASIRRFFASRSRDMPPDNEVQGLVPVGARPLDNDCGTAPGLRAEYDGAVVYCLPGVPLEMKAMYRRHVAPEVAGRAAGAAVLFHTLHCYGATEAAVGSKIVDLMGPGKNPYVGTTASHGVISIRITAAGPDARSARGMLDGVVDDVRGRLGGLVFGEGSETLAAVCGSLLRSRRQTLTTAESCTGGLLAKMITDVPGASDYFVRGLVTYSNESKTDLLGVPAAMLAGEGAVTEATARAMATGARSRAAADHALAITGIAGPGGGSAEKPVGLVYVARADADGAEAKRLLLGDMPRDEIRVRACNAALNMLRLRLL